MKDGSAFLWISERNDWRHVFRVSRDGREITDLTPGAFDITELLSTDEENGWVYFVASMADPTQRYLYRSSLDGSGNIERVTPANFNGSNQYQMSEDGRWAIHTWSGFSQPPVISVISLPDHQSHKVLIDNAELNEKLAAVVLGEHEFFKVNTSDGLVLDGYLMKPAGFSPGGKYPIVMYVYGEPWGSTVQDRWDPKRYLFHQLLLRRGFLVASIDNRGTRAPRGRAWRKSIYGAVGKLASRDQSEALHAMVERWPFIDASRVGVWGHSGGGSMTLNLMFRYPGQYQTGIARAPVPDQLLYDAIYQERYSGLLKEYGTAYVENSPISHAANLQGDLLLVHGTGDDNVHYQGSERLIDELVRHNKQFDFMSYPNRSHSLEEGDGTTLHLNTMMLNYFSEHLNPGGAGSAPTVPQ
jgi:dipeptidyl-peptidase-4